MNPAQVFRFDDTDWINLCCVDSLSTLITIGCAAARKAIFHQNIDHLYFIYDMLWYILNTLYIENTIENTKFRGKGSAVVSLTGPLSLLQILPPRLEEKQKSTTAVGELQNTTEMYGCVIYVKFLV